MSTDHHIRTWLRRLWLGLGVGFIFAGAGFLLDVYLRHKGALPRPWEGDWDDGPEEEEPEKEAVTSKDENGTVPKKKKA